MQEIEIFRHNIGTREIREATRVLRGLFLTTGREVERFEAELASFLGVPHVVGVTSCTGALHLALTALGVGRGDEVITTPMTFAATALPVHLYGQMCDMRAIHRIAERHGLAVVEDAAHALEAGRDGVRVGELSDAACFSFYATKSITCGEGGAVATTSEQLARDIRRMRHHGMDKSAADRYGKDDVDYQITMMGWKYNMNNIQAALLLGQLARAEKLLQKRTRLAGRYSEKLAGVPGVKIPPLIQNCRHGWHLFTILVPPDKRREFVRRLKEMSLGVSINYIPVHLQKFFKEKFGFRKGAFPAAEAVGASTVSLPLYPKLTFKEQDVVVSAVRELAVELNFS